MKILFTAFAVVLLLASTALMASAQQEPGSSVFVQQPPPAMYPSNGALAFERVRLDFSEQSPGVQNCVNTPINNTTDHPRVLTALISRDPAHYSISSPAEGMLPMTIGAKSSLYIAICFKADVPREYKSEILAIFQSDTARLQLTGKIIDKKNAAPVPTTTELEVKKKKKNEWSISVGLPRHATITLNLENALGKVVHSFPFFDIKAPGYYGVEFDGKDDNKKPLAKGSYVLRLEMTDVASHSKVHASKMLEIK